MAGAAARMNLSDSLLGRAAREDSGRRASVLIGAFIWQLAGGWTGKKKPWECGRLKPKAPAFWLGVLTELANRGIKDIFIACVDGLKGFPEAIETVFAQARVQICIVHQIRNSLAFVSYKERKAVAADLKPIYPAATAEEALFQLELFAEKWPARYPLISKSWRSNCGRIEPMFEFPAEIRRAIYTTNVIESLNMSLRKITKTKAAFPSEAAAFKLIWLRASATSRKSGRCRFRIGRRGYSSLR